MQESCAAPKWIGRHARVGSTQDRQSRPTGWRSLLRGADQVEGRALRVERDGLLVDRSGRRGTGDAAAYFDRASTARSGHRTQVLIDASGAMTAACCSGLMPNYAQKVLSRRPSRA